MARFGLFLCREPARLVLRRWQAGYAPVDLLLYAPEAPSLVSPGLAIELAKALRTDVLWRTVRRNVEAEPPRQA